MDATNTIDWSRVNFDALEQNINGQAKSQLHATRREAFKKFEEVGFPTTKREDWRYTNISALVKDDFHLSARSSECSIDPAQVAALCIPNLGSAKLVFVDGHFQESLSDLEGLPSEITLESLSRVLSEDAAAQANFEAGVGKTVAAHEESLVSLNTAYLTDGVYLNVPKNVVVEKPIECLFISTAADERFVSNIRLFCNFEEGASATLIESFSGLGSNTYFTSVVTEFFVAAKANVNHVKLQREGRGAIHYSCIGLHQQGESAFKTNSFSFGGKLVRNDIVPVLDGEFIDCHLNGISVLDSEQHVDNHTIIDHAKPNSESIEQYKGIYADRSHGVFNGTIIVRPDAQKTNAIQSNGSLLLSDTAVIDSQPQLKIWADDVKCTHGATIGQLDEEALFYLRSRGIGKEDARKMLVRAFASDIVELVEIDAVQELVEGMTSEKLSQQV